MIDQAGMQPILDYIEGNLTGELSAGELAGQAGFSPFHFSRLFQQTTGLAPMQYVLKRRLLHAVSLMGRGETGVDAALRYGFDTYAGFYKAFRREFDCSPSRYLKKFGARKPPKINLLEEGLKMTPIKKIREILVHWGMENTRVGAYTYESSGFVADHVWTVGDSLILKASGSLTGLKNSVDLSRALEKAGFSAALPVPTIGGEDYVTEEGVHYCLTRRLTGRSPLSRDLIRGDGKTNGEPIGRGIGRLHLALRELDGREEPAGLENTDLFASVRDWAIPKTRASMSLPEEFYTDYLSLFGELAPKLPVQIIHRDPNPSNLLLREDHTVGFVDFEAADRRVRLYDPCYTATAVLSETFAGPDGVLSRENWFSLYRGILSGYDGVCPLTPEERRAAPYVVFSIQMVCVAFFGGLEKFAELARINKEMLRWLWDNREKLTL